VLEQSAGQDVPSPGLEGELIEIRLPATAVHLPVLRTLTADLAARLDFNLDEVADLRMAVDEACAGLVARAAAPTQLRCTFRMESDALWVVASAHTVDGTPPARDTFGWRVLTALVDTVDSSADHDTRLVTVQLCKRRSGTEA
jgi:serine/threonine-protein kinase RsbW